MISEDTKFDPIFKEDVRSKEFVRDKSEQDYESDLVAKMNETVMNAVEPIGIDLTQCVSRQNLQAPPTNLGIDRKDFPLKP